MAGKYFVTLLNDNNEISKGPFVRRWTMDRDSVVDKLTRLENPFKQKVIIIYRIQLKSWKWIQSEREGEFFSR